MEEHMRAVENFHQSFSTHTEWIEKAEKSLSSFKNRRKTVEAVLQQIASHEVCADSDRYDSMTAFYLMIYQRM